MFKSLIAGLAIASVAFFVGCDSKDAVDSKEALDAKSVNAKLAAHTNTKTIEVKKMTCGGCAAKVKKILANVEGMEIINADPKNQTVQIAITDESKFDMDKAIAAIIEKAGREATVK